MRTERLAGAAAAAAGGVVALVAASGGPGLFGILGLLCLAAGAAALASLDRPLARAGSCAGIVAGLVLLPIPDGPVLLGVGSLLVVAGLLVAAFGWGHRRIGTLLLVVLPVICALALPPLVAPGTIDVRTGAFLLLVTLLLGTIAVAIGLWRDRPMARGASSDEDVDASAAPPS